MAGQNPDRYVSYSITTPAGTAIATPLNTPLNLADCQIVSAQILIPAGHSGVTGIQLVESGGVILPFGNPGTWIIGDDRDIPLTLNVQSSTAMSWRTYNLGNYPHTHTILLHTVDLPAQTLTLASAPSVIGLQG